MPLVVGREEAINDLRYSESPVTILIGDSGIGKSTVIEAAQRVQSNIIAPMPLRLNRGPDALFHGLIDALADAIKVLISGDDLAEFNTRITSTLRKLKDAFTNHIQSELTTLVIDLIRARYGDTAAASALAVKDAWSATASETLTRRLSAQEPKNVLKVLAQLGGEIAKLAESPVVLALDDLQNLTNDDQRRLADLVAVLPADVRIIGAYTVYGLTNPEALDAIADEGARLIRLDGLTERAVKSILTSSGIDPNVSPAVMRASNGYGLHVAASIQLLQNGGTEPDLGNLDRRGVIERSTSGALKILSPQDADAVTYLSAFARPMGSDSILKYLDLDAVAWARLRTLLLGSGLFISHGGESWFHELRRKYIWEGRIDDAARRQVAGRAARFLLVTDAPTFDDVELLGKLITIANLQASTDLADLNEVLTASTSQVAVAAALMELSENNDQARFVYSDLVLLHARDHFGGTGDLVAAIDQLHCGELIYSQTNQRAGVMCPRWTSRQAMVLAARSQAVMGRIPVPGAASLIIEALRPQLGAFGVASAAIGRQSISKLSTIASQLESERNGTTFLGGTMGPNLLVRASYGKVHWHASVTYDTVVRRDDARAALDNFVRGYGDSSIVVTDAVSHPLPTIASRRFVRALSRLLNYSLDNSFSTGTLTKRSLDYQLSVAQEMAARARLLEVVRDSSSIDERRAYDLEDPVGLYWLVDAGDKQLSDSRVRTGGAILHVVGASGAQELNIDDQTVDMFGPYSFFELSEYMHLPLGQRISNVTYNSTLADTNPLVSELDDLRRKAVAYNKSQGRVRLSQDAALLESKVAAARNQLLKDAQNLQEAFPKILGRSKRQAGKLLVAVGMHFEEFEGPRVGWAEMRTQGGEGGVSLVMLDKLPIELIENSWLPAWLREFEDVDMSCVERVSSGGLGLLADLLGYYKDEVDFLDWRA